MFNYIVTTDENSVLKYKSNGFDNIILSQWGFNNYSYSNTDLNDKKKIFDISFVGQPHSNRKKIIKKNSQTTDLKLTAEGMVGKMGE